MLAAISLATDIGMGQEPEKAIRACVLATGLARSLGLPEADVRDTYFTTLLRHLGCTATAHEEAATYGSNELIGRALAERTDFGDMRESMALMLATGKGDGLARPLYFARALRAGKQGSERIFRAICEVASHLASRLDLGEGVAKALYDVLERWDGKGSPQRLAGDAIAVPARIAEVATQAVIFDRLGEWPAVASMLEQRSGGWFDPSIAAAFKEHGRGMLAELAAGDPWQAVLDAEPAPHRTVDATGLDRVLRTFADMVDLKSPWTLGHSSEVARIAERAARALGFSEEDAVTIRRAGLVHDVGRVSVPNGIWDKRGPLTTTGWEAVRLHAYHSERILGRAASLAAIGRIAGMHHERLDGSGYHAGIAGASIAPAARLLAAADAYQAMTQDRPHRAALSPERAAEEMESAVASGACDAACVRAVLEAAGMPADAVKAPRPAGLTDREVEVLRLLARGLPNKHIAKTLVISPRTAEHHVQNIYGKIGVSTRAGAAVFAMEHDLLGP